MKVLLFSNKFPFPANDGSSIAIVNMIELLIHQKIDLHVLSLNTRKHYKNPQLFRDKYPTVKLYEIPINTDITPFNTGLNLLQKSPFHVSRFFNNSIDEFLKGILIKEDFDIIQLEGIFLAPYLDTIKNHAKGSVIIGALQTV